MRAIKVGSFTQDIQVVKSSKHTQVLTHMVHPHHWSLLPSTLHNALALVNIIHILKYLGKAGECCSLAYHYHFCRTAVPFHWCPCALGLVESCQPSRVALSTGQRFPRITYTYRNEGSHRILFTGV